MFETSSKSFFILIFLWKMLLWPAILGALVWNFAPNRREQLSVLPIQPCHCPCQRLFERRWWTCSYSLHIYVTGLLQELVFWYQGEPLLSLIGKPNLEMGFVIVWWKLSKPIASKDRTSNLCQSSPKDDADGKHGYYSEIVIHSLMKVHVSPKCGFGN
jgi:hypothetical protein